MSSITTPPPADVPPDPFTPLTLRRIDFRVARLARVFRLSREDAEDLRQDAWCEVLGAMRRYSAALGTVGAFTRGVLDLWYMRTARSIRARARFEQFPEHDVADPAPDHVRAADLRMDLEAWLAALPRDERLLAEELKDKTPAEIAESAGVHRGTVYRRLKRLSAHYFGNIEKAG